MQKQTYIKQIQNIFSKYRKHGLFQWSLKYTQILKEFAQRSITSVRNVPRVRQFFLVYSRSFSNIRISVLLFLNRACTSLYLVFALIGKLFSLKK